ncbi:hypothetical protein QBC35DRAFT_492122 [Podospora australis]|uniref:Nucleotide exchange factor SIL1 n=1 Tax=Podospora australis TaxID=1536484 RepID=A0AAN6WWJ6_9PEZI|nr:hypothetical protein QBC35DRAFT_492122 [Podospora australis]
MANHHHHHRLKMLPLSLLALTAGITAVAASSPDTPPAQPPAPSPSADVELICHTNNPAECYPKIFQPTDQFQIVHPDQDLPLGLHVRLNIATGQKEAKINVPDEINPELAGLPVDSSIVVVEPNQDDSSSPPPPPKPPANAPAYDPAGKIKEPPSSSKEESTAFYKSLTILKKGLDVDSALESLEDISHDIYFGLKIAEDYDTIRQLFCLANTADLFSSSSSSSPSSEKTNSRARLAALTLAGTVQNNPKALAEVEKHWQRGLSQPKVSGCIDIPRQLFTFTFTDDNSASSATTTAAVAKARLSALSGLLKSPIIRVEFLAAGGPEEILSFLNRIRSSSSSSSPAGSSDGWEGAYRTAAFLMLDNFLDGEMGAALGEWPRGNQAHDSECLKKDPWQVTAECWDWTAHQFSKHNAKDRDHWSHDLAKKLVQQRKANNKMPEAKGRSAKEEL